MTGLNRVALGCLFAAVPLASQAEFVALDESALGNVTAQAGITIELAAALSIGQIAYEDEGFLVINNVRLAGSDLWTNPNSRLDNVLLNLDVAGPDTTALEDQWGWGFTGGFLQDSRAVRPVIEDGDLVINLHANTFGGLTNPFTAADYGLSIGSVGLVKSTGGPMGTVLASNINLTGYLGPLDIVIQENVGVGTEVMNINGYFTTEGSVTANFIGTTFDLAINNFRGGNTFPFAHFQLDVGTRENGLGFTDGLVINVQDLSGDMDLANITFGADAGREAIGHLFFTDIQIQAEMVVYGH